VVTARTRFFLQPLSPSSPRSFLNARLQPKFVYLSHTSLGDSDYAIGARGPPLVTTPPRLNGFVLAASTLPCRNPSIFLFFIFAASVATAPVLFGKTDPFTGFNCIAFLECGRQFVQPPRGAIWGRLDRLSRHGIFSAPSPGLRVWLSPFFPQPAATVWRCVRGVKVGKISLPGFTTIRSWREFLPPPLAECEAHVPFLVDFPGIRLHEAAELFFFFRCAFHLRNQPSLSPKE